ncbi:MAG: O-acetylhomoserine aminocarboxypropyltransferase/cysteine synthase family protein [Gammaproteobacteria bacterium]
MRDETKLIHSGYAGDPTTHAVATPIYQTVAYEFDSAQHGADLFNLAVPGNIYTRIMNPTTDVLEKRLADLEGGVAALCVSAGSAAINYAILNILTVGRNIVTTPQLYGGTWTLFAHMLPAQGIRVKFAKSDSPADIAAEIDADTRAIFCESIGNPAGNVADIAALAAVATAHGVPLIVDNTVATPVLVKPISHGAHIVVHSLTKYIGGHGNSLGGAIVDGGNFPWATYPDKFPMLCTPEPSYHGVVYTEALGAAAYIGRARTVPLRNTGSALSPMNAFLLLQGMETLALRMERHCHNALAVAEWLQHHPRVASVGYAGLPGHRHHALAKAYCRGGLPASLLGFEVKGGFEEAVRFYDRLKVFKRLVNIGDAKSLACHPASTTHRQLTPEEQARAGVTAGMIRLCVGIEHIDDILEDLRQALAD